CTRSKCWAASLALFDWRWPMSSHAMGAVDWARFSTASCTRFSPTARRPYRAAYSTASNGCDLVTASSSTSPGSRPPPAQAATILARTASARRGNSSYGMSLTGLWGLLRKCTLWFTAGPWVLVPGQQRELIMQIENFKIFADLVETKSFSKAAKLNAITQSAVSQQARAMERHFKGLLIDRSQKQFQLTREGQRVY